MEDTKVNKGSSKLSILLGGLTLVLFAAKPYLLDLIEPAKSVGQMIGENAKDLITIMNGEEIGSSANSRREIWSNIITILAFALFAASIVLAIHFFQNEEEKWYGVGGMILSIVGLGVYISHLAIGLLGFIVIAVLAVILSVLWGG